MPRNPPSPGTRRLWLLAFVCLTVSGCYVFLPETRDRMELARRAESDTCHGTEIDPLVIGPDVIERATPLYASVPSRSGYDVHFLGAKLRVRPTPSMTPALLERMLRCHGARQTLGTEPSVAGSPYFLPNGWVDINVDPEDGAYVVKLSSHDHESAKEILARARAYKATPARPREAEAPLLPPDARQ